MARERTARVRRRSSIRRAIVRGDSAHDFVARLAALVPPRKGSSKFLSAVNLLVQRADDRSAHAAEHRRGVHPEEPRRRDRPHLRPLTPTWSIGGKYAHRRGELSLSRDNPEFFDNTADLFVLRTDFRFKED
jgi:hypothetical protein